MSRQSITIFHPGQQHSHQLAAGLSKGGLLRAYYSGKPVLTQGITDMLWQRMGRVRSAQIDPARAHWRADWLGSELWAKKGPTSGLARDECMHVHFHRVDRWFSQGDLWREAKLVVGFENSCSLTFSAARQQGIRCVLEAPNIHWRTAERLLGSPSGTYWSEVRRRKDQEIELSDHIVVCSELARASYLEEGVPASKVTALLLGGDLGVTDIPSPADESPGPPMTGPLRLLFAGVSSRRKGMDRLLDAIQRINKDQIRVRLDIAGGVDSPTWIDCFKQSPGVQYLGHQGSACLASLMSAADFLVLPSRFDSFGMVVVEALRCGTPVVLTDTVGAAAVLADFPQAGHVMRDGADLFPVLQTLCAEVRNAEKMRARRTAALTAAQRFEWAQYHRRAADLYGALTM